MESLVPSEIARLVYGYLIDENCEGAAQLFLETSSSLKECLHIHKKGRKFNTSVLGLSLVDLLNLYTDAVCLVKNYSKRKESLNKSLSDFVKELSNILVIDNDIGSNIAKTVFLRISVPNKRKGSKNSENVYYNDEEEDEEEEEEEETYKEGQNGPNNGSQAEQKSISQVEQKSIGQVEQKLSCQNELTKTSTESDETAHSKNSCNDEFDLNMLQALLDNTALHERIAENINKAIDTNGKASNEKTGEKKIIETIVTNTEADPIFRELLEELVGPRAEETTTPEDTDKENGDPLEDRQTSTSQTVQTNAEVPDDETMKKIAEESNLAIEGILAGNKQMQQDVIIRDKNVPIAPKPTETLIFSKPQLVSTSTGVYQQSFIIPAGYRVTDVIPVTQVQASSTPFRLPTNITTLEQLSPISAPQVSVSKSSANVRGFRQPRRRRVLPKSETFIIQLPGQDGTIQEVQAEIPASSKRIAGPEVIKRSRVRTRGGLQKVGTRGIKSVPPQQTSDGVDKNIEVIYAPNNLKKSNTSSIETRSMAKTQQIKKNEPEVCSETVAVEKKNSEEPEIPANPIETTLIPIEEKNTTSHNKEENDATPEQQILAKKPRVSLSTPRRSHVRTLDFATPPKELAVKKSLTSPKVYHHKKNESTSLESIKRGIGFNSPLKTISEENEKVEAKNNKKDWDADLRNFTSAGESMDIPTSVGLKRKNVGKKDKIINGKRKGPKGKITKKVLKKKPSNEELVNQIEKEVKDVVGEELLLNSSITSEMGNLIEQKLAEELDKNDSLTCMETPGNLNDKPQVEPAEHLTTAEETTMSTKTSENVYRTVDDNNTESRRNEEEHTTNDNKDKEENSNPEVIFSTSTPLKIAMSPVHENSRGQLTPTTKIVMSHLGKGNLHFPSVFSPTSQGSLENILIKECSRMESEKAMTHLSQDIKKLDSPMSDTTSCNTIPLDSAKNIDSNHSTVSNKELTFESACKSIFETPAKLMSAPVPPGTPVEMTPLTKVLASEISFSKTVLVTPTLPPTPKQSSLETPQKTDENPILSSTSGSDSGKVVEENSISPKKQQEILNIENFKDCSPEMSKCADKSPNSLTGPSIKSGQDPPENTKCNEFLNKSNEIKPFTSIRTPQIKLKTRKLNKATLNDPLSKKNKKNVRKHQESNSPEHQTDNLTSKANSEHNLSSQLEEELNISNHSEQSNQNKDIEEISKKITCSKQTQSETKKRIVTKQNKKLSSPDQNRKKTSINNTIPVTKSKVHEEMESEILHLLKDTKAKLFGPDNSSDSDSDSASDNLTQCKSTSRIKKANAQWKTASERLQKLDNVKMLESSSSSDDENESVPRHEAFGKDLHVKKKTNVDKQCSNVEANLELNQNMRKNDKSSVKKFDEPNNKSEPIKNSKTIIKETEESCESFPTLHLSEESNQSLKSNNYLSKPSKLRKSPSGGNDSLGATKVGSLLVNTPILKPRTEQLIKNVNKGTSVPDQINTNKPSTSNDEGGLCDQANNSEHQQFHLNEHVFHTSKGNETLKSEVSDSSEKLNNSQIQAVSKYLDNYVYTFSLNDDKSGNSLTKELRTSQFFSIFDLDKNSVVPQYGKRVPSRPEHRSHTRSHNKNSKRPRSVSSSEDENEMRSRNRDRVYRSYRSGRFYRGHQNASFYDRRISFSRGRYTPRKYDSRHRDYDHYSPYDKKRPRHESPEPRRSSKKEDRRKLEEKVYSTRFDTKSSYDSRYSSVNDSFGSSKSGSEVDGKNADCTYSSDRTVESRGRCSTSSQRLSIVVKGEPFYSKPKPLPMKRSKPLTDREDGELSDSSGIKRISPEANRKHMVLSLGAHDSRATLLKKVDLDHFLSLVHGNEK